MKDPNIQAQPKGSTMASDGTSPAGAHRDVPHVPAEARHHRPGVVLFAYACGHPTPPGLTLNLCAIQCPPCTEAASAARAMRMASQQFGGL